MTARTVLGPDATRDQWLNARRTGITGTAFRSVRAVRRTRGAAAHD